MPRRRFRWTRALYRQASSLARLLAAYPYHGRGEGREPLLVRRFYRLWDEHPQRDDTLGRVPAWRRLKESRYLDDIPF